MYISRNNINCIMIHKGTKPLLSINISSGLATVIKAYKT